MQFIVCSTVCSVAPSREDFLKMILTLQITWKHTLIVIESLTNKFINQSAIPFVKVFPPQMLSSSWEGAIVQAVPIAFAPVIWP